MSGDEVDYFFRLRTAGDVISVISARHYHPNVEHRPFTPLKMYYYLKNTLVLNGRYFDFVSVRNIGTVIAVLVRTARRNGLSSVVSLLFGRTSSSFYSAISRGLAGRIAKDFDG
jgi:GT2 family glycosyltransferase